MRKEEDEGSGENGGLLVRRIQNGTVIDHISPGEALNVVKILGITGTTTEALSIATNVPSGQMGKKDIVKLSNRELSKEEVNRIALISPHATINIIRNYKVCEKKGVEIPDMIEGLVKCPNPGCISNTNEPIKSRFIVTEKGLRCTYCDWVIGRDIPSHII
jgi:aspartate carbamoyltransferase regulatory subunit